MLAIPTCGQALLIQQQQLELSAPPRVLLSRRRGRVPVRAALLARRLARRLAHRAVAGRRRLAVILSLQKTSIRGKTKLDG